MAVTAQSGIFSFGGQTAKGTIAATYYQHRAQNIDLGIVSDDRIGPPEVGGISTPTFPYRAGVSATGGALINPRLENTIGWLFYGALGAWSAEANKNVFGTTVTGMTAHSFLFSTTLDTYLPWMTFRKYIPGSTTTDAQGEIYIDSKIVGLTVALPNDGPLSMRVDVQGRAIDTQFAGGPSWTYGNTTMEDYQSIPVGCAAGGYFKVPDFSATALPIVQATFTLANQPLDPRQEKVFGSPYLEDVTIVQRNLAVEMMVKWTDPQLYNAILTGTTTGTQWSANPWVSDLDIYGVSGGIISTTTEHFQLRLQADAVRYAVVGGIQLAGGQAVMMRIRGEGIAPSTGNFVKLMMGNAANATAYTWPA